MKRFIVKAIFISASVLISLIIADIIKTKDYRSRDYYPFKIMTYIVDGHLDSDLWILGSSRAWVQYNPRILDSILNVDSYVMGFDAQSLFSELQYYQIARINNPKPQYLILDISFPSLTMDEAPISRYFLMPYINDFKVRNIVKNNSKLDFKYLFIPYYRFIIEKGNDFFYNYDIDLEYKGFKAKPYRWCGDNMNSLDTVHYKCELEAIELLNDFLTECIRDSIRVILVHSPFYYEGFKKIHNHEQMMALFRDIANKHNVPFLDYTTSPICIDTANFYNAMHLNAQGADLFSTQLAHDLDSMGLITSNRRLQ